MVAEAMNYHPVYVHFDLSVGLGKTSNIDWTEVEEFLTKTGTEMINVHVVAPETLNPCDEGEIETLLDSIVDEVQIICKRFGEDRVIAENVPLPAAFLSETGI
jgi:hypothetical protein